MLKSDIRVVLAGDKDPGSSKASEASLNLNTAWTITKEAKQ